MLRSAQAVWVTEAVLVEIGNALSSFHRRAAVRFLRHCYETANTIVVAVDSELLHRGLSLYEARSDKTWGLTDCISFVVMKENDLSIALTADRHFVQAGFRALMLESDEEHGRPGGPSPRNSDAGRKP